MTTKPGDIKYRNPSWLLDREIDKEPLLKDIKKSKNQVRQIDKRFLKYQNDPIGFCTDILGEDYPPEIKVVMESVRDNQCTIAKSSTGVGKSFSAARVAVWFFKCFPGAQIFLTSAPPEDNIKSILWGQIDLLTLKHPDLFIGDTKSGMKLESDPQWFIKGVTIPSSGTPAQREAKFSGKHAPFLLFIVDEGDGVPDEVYKGIEGCISGGHARLLIMFNPRQQAGPVYLKERDRQGHVITLSALEHPNVVTGEDVYPGAVKRSTTVERINNWTRPLIEGELPEDVFVVPSYLEGFVAVAKDKSLYPPLPGGVRKIVQPEFSYMVLGRYPSQDVSQLISKSWVDRAVERYHDHVAKHGEVPPKGIKPILGLDVAEKGVDNNVACLRYGDWVTIPRFWNSIDPIETADKAADIYTSYECQRAFVDQLGPGGSVAGLMQKAGCTAIGIKVNTSPTRQSELGAFTQLRDQLYWEVREWLRGNPNSMLPPDKELLEELLVPQYQIPNGKIKVTQKDEMRRLLARSPDKLDALAMTFSQESDKLLHLYEVCSRASVADGKVVITDGVESVEGAKPKVLDIFQLSGIVDFGFVARDENMDAWAIARLWVAPNGTVIIPQIWRTDVDDPSIVVEKVFEAHRKRPFRAVGAYSDLTKMLRTHWNIKEQEMADYIESLKELKRDDPSIIVPTPEQIIPDLIMIKAIDRLNRQLVIRDMAKTKKVAVTDLVTSNNKIWAQFSHCETLPDDSRDAISGAITLMLREC